MNLSKKEFMLIVDSTNSLALWPEEYEHPSGVKLTVKEQVFLNVRDSISIDQLDEKWEVNKDELIAKMEAGSEEEYKELWNRIEAFWAEKDRQDNGE